MAGKARSNAAVTAAPAPTGYRPTPAGIAVLGAAEAVADAVAKFERQCAEAANESILRLTCPEPIAVRLSRSGFLDRFQAAYPDLRIEFVLADRYIDLAKGEADVAFRSGDTTGVLVGRKVADSIWAIYASSQYVRRHGAPASIDELAQHPLIAFDSGLSRHRLSIWLGEVAPDGGIVSRSDSVLGLVSATKSGVGIAALPIALGDDKPDLIRILPPVPELTRAWRILCHPEVRHLRRVDAFFDFVARECEALKSILSG